MPLGNLTTAYSKSFYFYKGSESTPPCLEGVYRYVMKTPITLPSSTLKAIKTAVFDNEVEPAGNAR